MKKLVYLIVLIIALTLTPVLSYAGTITNYGSCTIASSKPLLTGYVEGDTFDCDKVTNSATISGCADTATGLCRLSVMSSSCSDYTSCATSEIVTVKAVSMSDSKYTFTIKARDQETSLGGRTHSGDWIAGSKVQMTMTAQQMPLTSTPQTIGFTIAGGTTPKTLTVPLDASVSGTNTGDQTKIANLIGGNSTTLLGSMPYQSDTDTTTLLSPNTTITKKFLSQTGTGTNGAIPAWAQPANTDITGLGTMSTQAANNVAITGGSVTGVTEHKLPLTKMDNFATTDLVKYLQKIHYKNQYIEFKAGTYAHGITAVASAYVGGVYSPTQNRIYLVPLAQANQTNWHYIQEFSTPEISRSIAANCLFNKF